MESRRTGAKHNINLVRADMFRLHTLTDGIASRMLARHGISAVWELQVAAAIVYRTGNRTAAECILKMADAAEREWMKAVEMPVSII